MYLHVRGGRRDHRPIAAALPRGGRQVRVAAPRRLRLSLCSVGIVVRAAGAAGSGGVDVVIGGRRGVARGVEGEVEDHHGQVAADQAVGRAALVHVQRDAALKVEGRATLQDVAGVEYAGAVLVTEP